MLSRRDTILTSLKAMTGVAVTASSPLGTLLASPVRAQGRGQADGVPYGAAVRDGPLASEPDYRAALVRHCRQLVGEGGLKWYDLRPSRERFVYDLPDKQIDFASRNGMTLRGHTLVWYGAMPDWTKSIASASEAEREMVGHIETVMGRYRGRIKSWDVINEPIPDDPASRSDMNEYDIEFVGPRFRRKREAFLRLIRDLKLRNVPLHAIGLQGHLRGELPIDREGLSAFIAECRSMGLKVLVTELDVVDDKLPGPPEVRDILAASRVYDFLDAIRVSSPLDALLTWGISDRYTWVPLYFKRTDGHLNRPLPLDSDYRPKPMMRVIEHFLRDRR
jgi:endo-1,4-beta-xylanase